MQDQEAGEKRLGRARLAYENRTFVNGPEGRILRINAEYLEPLARFRRERIQDTVVFFGSARFINLESAQHGLEEAERTPANGDSPVKLLDNTGAARLAPVEEQPGTHTDGDLRTKRARAAVEMAQFYEDARRLAYLLTEWAMGIKSKRARFVVTSGGGPGIMEAANRGASEAGGKTIGLNIKLPFEQFPNRWVTPALNFEFHYFFMRKYWFAYLAKALVVFPGGFGTIDEAFEILTLTQTRKLAKNMRVIIYGRKYWDRILNFEAMVDSGTIAPKDLNLFSYADTPEEALELLKKHLSEHLNTQSPRTLRPEGHLEHDSETTNKDKTPEIAETN
ncbi:MAG: TIGR00730 family Rossman fold protein [Acidobacteriaceae bacterium]